MIVFSREVIACRCGTDVPAEDPEAGEVARSVVIEQGGEADIATLDRDHHNDGHLDELRARLRAGDRFVVGRLGGRIAHYFWLSLRPACAYPSLPGCVFDLDAATGYGYDAWTHP